MAGAMTHLYVGLKTVNNKLTSKERLLYIFGGAFPDLEFLIEPTDYDNHKNTKKLAAFILKEGGESYKNFVKGMKAHVLVDDIIHGAFMKNHIAKLKHYGLGDKILHSMIEAALDILLAEKLPLVKRYTRIKRKRFEEIGFGRALELLCKYHKKKPRFIKKLKKDCYKMLKLGLIDKWSKALKLWLILRKYPRYRGGKKREEVTVKKLFRAFDGAMKLLKPEADAIADRLVTKVEKSIKWN